MNIINSWYEWHQNFFQSMVLAIRGFRFLGFFSDKRSNMFYASELWQLYKEEIHTYQISKGKYLYRIAIKIIRMSYMIQSRRKVWKSEGQVVMLWAWSAPLVGIGLTDLPNLEWRGKCVPPPSLRFHRHCITLETCWVNKTKKSLVTNLGMPLYTKVF